MNQKEEIRKDIIKKLEKRAEHFDSIHHSYESREIRSAIDVIERLMPPELFYIPVVIVPKGTLPKCEHKHIIGGDGCFECADCGA